MRPDKNDLQNKFIAMENIARRSVLTVITILIAVLFSSTSYCQIQQKMKSGKSEPFVQVIELRNYLMRPGHRDEFITGFEDKIIDTLNARGNLVLGQFIVKGSPDNFFWIRGFKDMQSRLKCLKGFYSSEYWSKHVYIPIAHVINYNNVYLLKPVDILSGKMDSVKFNVDWFGKEKGIAVVEFIVANERLSQLLNFMGTKLDPITRTAGVRNISYWISELTPNNYPDLPAFQDKNLLVSISFYQSETEYNTVMQKVMSNLTDDLKFEMLGYITTKTTMILYPTAKSYVVK